MALELEIGSTFAGHRIEALAGRGGMGIVYRATDLALHRQVALKLIAPALAVDPVFRERFAIECRSAAAIDHPHAVPVYHAGEENGALFVTMRFVEGTDLGEVMRDEGRLEPERAVGLVAQVAGALDAAHGRGFVHRDVKPTNILIAARDAGEHAFLTDFGLSKPLAASEGLTKPGFVMGTADYMAPEHARGADVDGRSDVYALACVLYQALAGTVVFDRGSDLEKMWAHLHDPPPSLHAVAPDLPPALDDVLCRALAKDREDRHGSAGEFARDAAAALQDGGEVPLRVVVAEDSVLLRAGVVQVLRDAGLDVVAEAGDGEELLAAVRAQRPDVAVTDIRMPPDHSDEGLRAARKIREEMPGTGVLVLSQYAEEAYVAELLGETAEGARLPAQGPGRRPRGLRRRRAPGRPGRLGARPGGRPADAQPPARRRSAPVPERARARGARRHGRGPLQRHDRGPARRQRAGRRAPHLRRLRQARPATGRRGPPARAGRPHLPAGVASSGIRPRTCVPAPGRERISSAPPTAASRSRMLVKPTPPPSTSDGSKPAPSSRTSTFSNAPSVGQFHDRAARAVRVLLGVLQRLQAAEVGGALDLARVAADTRGEHRGREARAQRGGAQRLDEPAVGERGRVDPARERPHVVERLLDVGRRARAGRRRPSSSARSAASSSLIRSATSRCWAPSCRSRSIRRRSSSAAAWMRPRDSRTSRSSAAVCAERRWLSSVMSAYDVAVSTNARSSRSAASWTIAGDAAARRRGRRSGSERRRPRPGPSPGRRRRRPSCPSPTR